jgi:hypothetical protein
MIYFTTAPKGRCSVTNENRHEGATNTREVTPKTKEGNWSLQLLFGRPELFAPVGLYSSVCSDMSVSQTYMMTDLSSFPPLTPASCFYVSAVVVRSSGLHGRRMVRVFRKSRQSTGNSVIWVTYKKSCLHIKVELLKAEMLLLLTVNNNNNNNNNGL